MVYRYTGYTHDGRFVRGTIESSSVEVAEDGLYKAGFQRIITLHKANSEIDWKKMILGSPKVSAQVLLDFTTELAILTKSGLTLLAALKQLEKQSSESSLRNILSKVSADLKAGAPLHKAIAKHPQVFSETYCSMIEANEKSGTLDFGLQQIAKEIKQQIATKSQLQHALIQPAIVTVVAVAVVFLLTIVVLPPLVDVFRQFGTELPFLTRLLIGFTDFVNLNKLYIIGAVIFIPLAVTMLAKHKDGKQLLEMVELRLPMIGNIIIWNTTARFSRTMANLLKSGILLADSMKIVVGTLTVTRMRDDVIETRRKLMQGQTFSASMSHSKLFPKLLIEMITVGESSGSLDSSLSTVADYFENKVQKRIEKLTSLLEPILILILGLGVGIIAVSVISAIYGLVGSMN